MLHAAAGVQKQNLTTTALTLHHEKRCHKRRRQKNHNQNLKIHEYVVHKFFKKGTGLLVFQQPLPEQIG